MREELHDCDFLFFLDADAFFYSHELKIEDELIPFLGSKHVMISADYVCERYRPHPHKPNTGVILLRNTKKSAEFLRVWDATSERPGLEEFRFKPLHEQETCYRTVWQEYGDDVTLLKEYYLMNSHYGVFIRHLMGMTEEERLRRLKKFLKAYGKTIPGCEDLNDVMSHIPNKTWEWGIGVLTTTHRPGGMLARTLESYRETGFDPPIVFADANRNGGLWNLHRALKTLVKKYPNANAYMIIEDDVLFSKNIREYLEAELWPSVEDHGCICSIFTPTYYSSDERWHIEKRGSRTWMSQCRIYHPLSAKKLVADLDNDARLQNKWRQNDTVVGTWAAKNNVDIWFHSPSLTQHMAPKNTSYEANRPMDYRIGLARDFIGENRSILEYWAEFGREPRKVRLLPRLEIVAREVSPGKDTPFQFTPEMAHNLAEMLNQYNCDIEEIAFVGDGLLSWEYAGRCVHPLRMTGKVMRMKIRLTPTEDVDLKPYELLFDAIDIAEEGTKTHLQDRVVADGSNSPQLMENEVSIGPIANRPTIEECGSKPIPDKPQSHRLTLDDFFQNLDEILTEIGEPPT